MKLDATKLRFIEALAEYLVEDQTRKSIELEMGKPAAKQWAKIRSSTPLVGYPTKDEAVAELTSWFVR